MAKVEARLGHGHSTAGRRADESMKDFFLGKLLRRRNCSRLLLLGVDAATRGVYVLYIYIRTFSRAYENDLGRRYRPPFQLRAMAALRPQYARSEPC